MTTSLDVPVSRTGLFKLLRVSLAATQLIALAGLAGVSAQPAAARSNSSAPAAPNVGTVTGSKAEAKISRYREAYPGVHVDGIERWLYPLPVPGS